jgi:hypothetical protein
MKGQISTKAKITKGGLNNYLTQTYIEQQKEIPLLSSVLPKATPSPRATPSPKVAASPRAAPPRASQSPTLVRKARAVSAPVLISPKASPQTPHRASPRVSPKSPTIVRRASSALQASPKQSTELSPYYIINTLNPEKKRILIKPQHFKANTIFTYLSHSIYNEKSRDKDGRLISPKNPPEYITYDMLIREVGIFLDDEIYTEEELKEQYNKADAKEQKALKSNLWRVWYNIIVGDDKEDDVPSKQRASKRIFKLETEDKSSTGGRRRKGGTGASPPEEQKYIDFLLATRKTYVDKADNTQKDKYGYTEKDYEDAYFNFADTKAPSKIRSSYDIKLGLINRLGNKKVIVHDIVCEQPPKDFPYPKIGFNTLYRPNKNLHLFGMQLPHQFNRELLLNSMIYLFHKKIYNIADLQGCDDAINRQNPRMNEGIGCNPYDRGCEPIMWERARLLTIAQDEKKCDNMTPNEELSQEEIDDYELKPKELKYLEKGDYYELKIKDMTAGHLWSWDEISNIKDVSKPENSIVVHCLAGAGRTASVMLYLMLRDSRNCLSQVEKLAYETDIKDRLAKPHFGLNNIAEVIELLKAYFINKSRSVKFATNELFKIGSKIMDKQTVEMLENKGVRKELIMKILTQGFDTHVCDSLILYSIDETMISELENRQVKSQASCSLLRQRLNRIFFFLARDFGIKEFYTYRRPTKQVIILPNEEFSNPVMRVVSDWNRYDMNVARGWIN